MAERIEHHACPADVTERLRLAGGLNPFGEPMFRVIWGFDRIVPMTGQWEDWEELEIPGRKAIRLKKSKVETRQVPKYLPGNRWHLEMWRPPEDYGSPEQWGKLGAEQIGGMTVDTAGPYPHRGEYELVFTISSNGLPSGEFVPLVPEVVQELVQMVVRSRDFSLAQRRAAIAQRVEREKKSEDDHMTAMLKEGIPAFGGRPTVAVPSAIETIQFGVPRRVN